VRSTVSWIDLLDVVVIVLLKLISIVSPYFSIVDIIINTNKKIKNSFKDNRPTPQYSYRLNLTFKLRYRGTR